MIAGAPEEHTDAQKLIVIANRLDGLLEWLGKDHSAYHQVHDIPEQVREVARSLLLPKAMPTFSATIVPGDGQSRL